jgi:hypothetical protein
MTETVRRPPAESVMTLAAQDLSVNRLAERCGSKQLINLSQLGVLQVIVRQFIISRSVGAVFARTEQYSFRARRLGRS